MNNFPWTDEMVKEAIRNSYLCVFHDHRAAEYDSRVDDLIEFLKLKYAPSIKGTADKKVYWAVNRKSLEIAPVSYLLDEENDRQFFSSYTDALKFIEIVRTSRAVNRVLPG